MDKERDFKILRLIFYMRASKASSVFHLAEMIGLGVGGGDLYGDSGHPTGLDCPAGVVECSCGGEAASACRSGAPEPVLTNPSNGAFVISVVQTGGGCGCASCGEACVTVGRQGHYTV